MKTNLPTPAEETLQTTAITVIKLDLDPTLPHELRDEIVGAFLPHYKQLQDMEAEYESIVGADVTVFTPKLAKQAGMLRKKYVAWRGVNGLKKTHEEKKAYYRLVGSSIDTLERIGRVAATEKEEKLRELEEFPEREEARRVAELHATRTEAITMYILDSAAAELAVLGEMTDEAWDKTFEKFRAAWNAEQERIAKEKLRKERLDIAKTYELYIEEFSEISWESLTEKMFNSIVSTAKDAHERREKAAEIERQKAEEIRLKAEQDAKEAEERAKRYRVRVAAVKGAEQREDGLYYNGKQIATVKSLENGNDEAFNTFLAGHLEKYASDVKLEEERQENERKAIAERAAAQARIQADIDAQKAAEEKARKEAADREAEMIRKKAEAQAAEEAAKGAPDSEKLRELAKAFAAIEIPRMSTEKGMDVIGKFQQMQEKWIAGIVRVAEELEPKQEEAF